MSTYIDQYEHLNEDIDCQAKILIDMQWMAEMVNSQNYGLHRFLSALINLKRQIGTVGDDEEANKLEKFLKEYYSWL
jgi:hypothetical protein